jgi:hypothetical protein
MMELKADFDVPSMEICSPIQVEDTMVGVVPNKSDDGAFDPEATASMAAALEDVCRALKVNGNERERHVLANRIIDLARDGERDRIRLRERVLREASRADDVL